MTRRAWGRRHTKTTLALDRSTAVERVHDEPGPRTTQQDNRARRTRDGAPACAAALLDQT